MTGDGKRGDGPEPPSERGDAPAIRTGKDPVDPRGDSRSSSPRPIADGGPPEEALFRAFPDPLLCYERRGGTAVVRAVNPAFERTFDVDGAAVPGDPLADHLPVDAIEGEPDARGEDPSETATTADAGGAGGDTAADALSRLDAGERVTVSTRRGAESAPRRFRLGIVPVGGTGEHCILYTDVTDLCRRVDELETRTERLERFIDVAAHDLRNPLDVAKIRLEAARDTGEDVHFEKVEAALDRIQHIVREVLSVGGAEIDPSEGVALGTVADAAWSTVDTAEATLDLEDDLPTVEADAALLQQLFENLFRNAVEHGRRDVTVTVGGLPDGFYVADDGPGVPRAERDRAFDPGYSTADGNTGLGLSIVRQIAEDHGWRVVLSAGDAGGALFEFVGIGTARP
jgi:signal transduction histidine kinase